jgi:putative Holliday junction resolvase
MSFLGIDYGSKRIGLAVADEKTKMATPLAVLKVAGKSSKKIAEEVAAHVSDRDIRLVVIGESKNFKGANNPIMKKIIPFSADLLGELGFGVEVVYEPEFLTSHQAQHLQGTHDLIDASAAALILQSYLDTHGDDLL